MDSPSVRTRKREDNLTHSKDGSFGSRLFLRDTAGTQACLHELCAAFFFVYELQAESGKIDNVCAFLGMHTDHPGIRDRI